MLTSNVAEEVDFLEMIGENIKEKSNPKLLCNQRKKMVGCRHEEGKHENQELDG
jgi:hypothetical protein